MRKRSYKGSTRLITKGEGKLLPCQNFCPSVKASFFSLPGDRADKCLGFANLLSKK